MIDLTRELAVARKAAKKAKKAPAKKPKSAGVSAAAKADEAVKQYVRGSGPLNEWLRSGKAVANKEFMDFDEKMSAIFSGVQPSKKKQTLFRGLKDVSIRVGDILVDKGYSSTSRDDKAAESFGGDIVMSKDPSTGRKKFNRTSAVLAIEVPKGSRVLHISGDLSGKGYGEGEDEAILHRGNKIKIVSKKTIKRGSSDKFSSTVILYKAELLDDGTKNK